MSKTPNPCHCGDEFNDYQKEQMRSAVCANVQERFLFNKQEYCILHLPFYQKLDKFRVEFERLISNGIFRFDGCWVPDQLDLSRRRFQTFVDFKWAIFNESVSFEDSVFEDGVTFVGCQFHSKASFARSVFKKNRRLLPANFHGVKFLSVVDFMSARFEENVDFSQASFLRGQLSLGKEKNEFLHLTSNTSFSYATFVEDAKFEAAVFGSLDSEWYADSFVFFESRFEKEANFQKAQFVRSTSFMKSVFKGFADFRDTSSNCSLSFKEARFETWAKFSGKNGLQNSWDGIASGSDFSGLIVDKPERIFFQSLRLDPNAFENTDLRKFDFADVKWIRKSFAFDWARFKDIWQFRTKEAKQRKSNYELLEVVYRRIAANEEENSRYNEASNFRYTAFDIQRLKQPLGRFPFNLLWWYKWTSRYGENWWWTALILLTLVLAVFPFLYGRTLFQVCPIDKPIAQSLVEGLCDQRSLAQDEGMRQSLAVASFQSLEYRKPISPWAETWSLVERITVPIQAALLALAIRRKFMR